MESHNDIKIKENVVKSITVSLRVDSSFLERFDDITSYFAYNRNEAIKEGMRRLLDDLTKRKLKIERLKR